MAPKTPRFRAKDLSEDEAASHLQGMWRARQARRKIRDLIHKSWTKSFDSASDRFYYTDNKGNSVWSKPSLLADDDDIELTPRSRRDAERAKAIVVKPKTPRFRAADLTLEQAAVHVQRAWRSKVARRRLQRMASSIYRKEYDPKSGNFYYLNSRTGEALWKNPSCLGDGDAALSAQARHQH